MTRTEAIRQTEQANHLTALGCSQTQAEQLRRISIRLRRCYEQACGTDTACLVRGRWNPRTTAFDYDEIGGLTYWEYAGVSGRGRYARTPDHERGAMRRLEIIMADVNRTRTARGEPALGYYLQTDPRGAALYLLRPDDVRGRDVSSCYTDGVCIF